MMAECSLNIMYFLHAESPAKIISRKLGVCYKNAILFFFETFVNKSKL